MTSLVTPVPSHSILYLVLRILASFHSSCVTSSLKYSLSASRDLRVSQEQIWFVSSNVLPKLTDDWPPILTATEPSFAVAFCTLFLFSWMDSTTPILTFSFSGMQSVVPTRS